MVKIQTVAVNYTIQAAIDAVRTTLTERKYDANAIDAFVAELEPLLAKIDSFASPELAHNLSAKNIGTYVDSLLKTAQTRSDGAVTFKPSLEQINPHSLIERATPKQISAAAAVAAEARVIDLKAKAAERGSYSQQMTNKHTQSPHSSIRSSQDKIVIGMNAIGGALMIADGVRRLISDSNAKDENGQSTVHIGPMVIASLQLMLGLGCAYVAHSHYQTTASAR